jgi:hypothetical protein
MDRMAFAPSPNVIRVAVLGMLLLKGTAQIGAQQYGVTVSDPAFGPDSGPRVLWDAGHHNDHHWGMEAFLEVIRQDGFRLAFHKQRFDRAALRDVDIVVVPGPLGVSRDSLLARGVEHYQWSDEGRSHALANDEVIALTGWIREGGSLLLILDHAPAPAAAGRLLEALGVEVRNSMTWDDHRRPPDYKYRDNQRASVILFSRQRESLGSHAIVNGRNATERVNAVITHVGASLVGPVGSTPLLLLSADAFDYWKDPPERGGQVHRVPAGGREQATAFSLDRGRVVVVSEYTVFQARSTTYQEPPVTYAAGMAYPGADDQQFATNVMRWLAGVLR